MLKTFHICGKKCFCFISFCSLHVSPQVEHSHLIMLWYAHKVIVETRLTCLSIFRHGKIMCVYVCSNLYSFEFSRIFLIMLFRRFFPSFPFLSSYQILLHHSPRHFTSIMNHFLYFRFPSSSIIRHEFIFTLRPCPPTCNPTHCHFRRNLNNPVDRRMTWMISCSDDKYSSPCRSWEACQTSNETFAISKDSSRTEEVPEKRYKVSYFLLSLLVCHPFSCLVHFTS